MIRFLCQLAFLFLLFACKSKYQKSFEEIEARDFNYFRCDTLGSWKEVELLTNAFIYRPDLIGLKFDRAEEYRRLGEWQKAKVDYEFLIEKDWASARIFLHKAYCEMQLKNYQVAYEDYLKVEKLSLKEWGELPQEIKSLSHWGNEYERFDYMINESRKKIAELEFLLK